MLIKSADDKSKRIALLESLQDSPRLDGRQKAWARDELVRLKRGIQGERDAAHYLDNYFADGRNHALIHDLRLVDGDDTAQIDHLVIGRAFEFYLLESKNFNGNLRINDLGEFSVKYGGQREFGIPSPLEQTRRHKRVEVQVQLVSDRLPSGTPRGSGPPDLVTGSPTSRDRAPASLQSSLR